MPEDDSSAIRDAAKRPAKASVDGQSVEQHKLREMIEADRYDESKRASRAGGLPVRRSRVVPPAADGADRGHG